MTIAILPFGTAPWIRRITKLDHEFRGTPEQLKKKYADQHQYIAVEGGRYHDGNEILFGIFKLIEASPYILTIDSVKHVCPTMGDVLVKLNDGQLRGGVSLDSISLTCEDSINEFSFLNRDGKIGVVQKQDTEQYFASMFFEVFTRYLHKDGEIVAPHQIPRSEWEAATIVGAAAYSVYPSLTNEQSTKSIKPWSHRTEQQRMEIGFYGAASLIEDLFFHYCGYSHNGPAYDESRYTNNRHEVHVAFALAQGKSVPDPVLEYYRTNTKIPSDLLWMKELIHYPSLRGAMPVWKMSKVLGLCRHERISITTENVDTIIDLANQLAAASPTYVEVDNHFYNHGFLKDFNVPIPKETFDPASLENDLARAIREQTIASQTALETMQINEKLKAGEISQREFNFRRKIIDQLPITVQATWANRYAVAIREKDFNYLLNELDSPDDQNQATKRALEQHFKVKLLGLRAKERHDAIFKLCKVEPEEQMKIEAEIENRQRNRELERKKKEILDRMAGKDVKTLQFGTLPVKEYVDKAVAKGFTRIARQSKGTSYTYWLYNPASYEGVSIRKSNGSFDYATQILNLEKTF